MIYPKHIQLHHAIGLKRVKRCIYPCFFEVTEKGTIFSDRFKPEQIITTKDIYVKLPDDMILGGKIRIVRNERRTTNSH